MRQFSVTVKTHQTRARYHAIAKSWYECWLTAVEEFGIECVVSIRPVMKGALK